MSSHLNKKTFVGMYVCVYLFIFVCGECLHVCGCICVFTCVCTGH